ncbi:F0F1 ATP synthase subunit epsilon [Cobetia amphilecti]|jgi:F-type H+-transporting ATPase subunit epsilon|uniref:ATP synthase epsilon chain n=1 Tax=Cobetia amphilecti TaxID=1055104 RepID=A0ABT6UQL5_9GAMM|nr:MULTISPECIES: F0F1 ATP synthase subunit epsilon [Cobetia]MBR9799246.1 F0F1 ATP synthase subunit epsilon [Gammaproteobacteria bacterium]MDI5884997.1 F0F1 ATP synthase subunit epsilon [Cobetia amphilecti]WOI24814.1 F0F1 ATP synthase subunit epsilon [Cobetia amphilecti]BBO56692.1 ATP synthase epsilon chain 2 [Cobetia sp. AM6]|tara:strand:+ start:1935 stop:2336 length:402 start_codon:yes stop_codon:yes gene_type:complete
MKLSIVTPLSIIVEQDIDSLRAEDPSGSFGILKGHCDFMTALSISAISWRLGAEQHFCALRGGVLTLRQGDITIATREAVTGDDLETLDRQVLTRFREDREHERHEHVEGLRLQLNALRQMVARRGKAKREWR